ncbi:hypothetical protein GCM10022243_65380 [Saccharothrix violaceirubra]|uniref:Uncharacterized protein n=1 Tax=Saccharothrix violaceirubra TaxID=413306 RepID=A0A7W7WZ03_9PSEU|nr:hypothetical protein [Saccharothrix violaceirubra]MBB4968975.1 hypothetical protein [Saccharothrix violaceirubra]
MGEYSDLVDSIDRVADLVGPLDRLIACLKNKSVPPPDGLKELIEEVKRSLAALRKRAERCENELKSQN